jgi:hypothetical protein
MHSTFFIAEHQFVSRQIRFHRYKLVPVSNITQPLSDYLVSPRLVCCGEKRLAVHTICGVVKRP